MLENIGETGMPVIPLVAHIFFGAKKMSDRRKNP